jgi:hypothetical protein
MRSAIMTNKVGDNTTAGRVAFCHFVSFSSIDNKQGEGGKKNGLYRSASYLTTLPTALTV